MSKRVCFYTSSHSWRNLQHWQFVNSTALAGKGWDVTVITTAKDSLYKRLRNKGINVIVFKKTGFLLPDIIRFSSLLKKHEISTLFINYNRDLFLTGLAGRLGKTNKIVFRRGTVSGIKFNLLNKIIFRKGYVSQIVTNTEAHKKRIESLRPGLTKNLDFKVIYNGVNLNKLKIVPELNRKYRQNGETIVGIADVRGAEELFIQFLRYFKNCSTCKKNFRFLIYKRGVTDRSIERAVSRLGLNGSVVWSVQEKNIDKFLDSIDVYLSIQSGNKFNYTALYAMAHFKPVIGMSSGSNIELIENNKNGFLYNSNDLNSVFNQLELLTNKKYRKKIGENARASVEKNFNFDTSVKKIESIIE